MLFKSLVWLVRNFYLVGLHYAPHFDIQNKTQVATKLNVTLYHWTMNEQLVPIYAKFNFYNYWTLSYVMCLKLHWIPRTKNYFDGRTNNWDILGPRAIFLSNRRTLKFLKRKCNPTNKKTLAQCIPIMPVLSIVLFIHLLHEPKYALWFVLWPTVRMFCVGS